MLKYTPDFLLKVFVKTIQIVMDKPKKEPLMKVQFPRKYFDSLDSIEFCNQTFKIPFNPKIYLSIIYGNEWKQSRTKWEISNDSPMTK